MTDTKNNKPAENAPENGAVRELNGEGLNGIAGGRMTGDAEVWFVTNRGELLSRAKEKGISREQFPAGITAAMEDDRKTYTPDTLRAYIAERFGIRTDDV